VRTWVDRLARGHQTFLRTMKLHPRVWSINLAVFAAVVLACSQSKPSSEPGLLTVKAFSKALGAQNDIAMVTITLTNLATGEVLTSSLTQPDGTGEWAIFFKEVRVGAYSIAAQAVSAAGLVRFQTALPGRATPGATSRPRRRPTPPGSPARPATRW